MAKYVGGRIVPTHGGVWDRNRSYEELTVVLREDTGNSYISKRPVPSGMAITEEHYWVLYSVYSAQVAEALGEMRQTTADLRAELSETAGAMDQRAEAAEKVSNDNKAEMSARMAAIEARQDVNARASTDVSADYAAEVVDARVDSHGAENASLGAAIRKIEENMDGFQSNQNIAFMATIQKTYVKADGTEASHNSINCSDYIRIPENATSINVFNATRGLGITPLVVFFDEEKAHVAHYGRGEEIGIIQEFTIPENAVYLRFNQSGDAGDADRIHVSFRRFSINDLIESHHFLEAGGALKGGEDLHGLPVNAVYIVNSTAISQTIANLPFEKWMGNVLVFTFSKTPNLNSGIAELAISSKGRVHVCISWTVDATWTDWIELASVGDALKLIDSELISRTGLIGSFTGTFEDTAAIHTGINLTSGRQYTVMLDAALATEEVEAYVSGDTANKGVLKPFIKEIRLTPKRSGELVLSGGGKNAFTVFAYEPHSLSEKTARLPKVYYVGSGREYQSVTKLFYDLRDDDSPKTIYIDGGDYDIYEDYKGLWDAGLLEKYTGTNPSMEYFPYCVWVPANTHLIGMGNVRFKWMPEKDDGVLTTEIARTVSPLNCSGSVVIDNIEVHTKNGRYGLHDDPLGKPRYRGARKIYRNVRWYNYVNDYDENNIQYGFGHVVGSGIDAQMHYEFENCLFKNYGTGRAFYMHDRSASGGVNITEGTSSDIVIRNCIFDTAGSVCVKFGNVGNASTGVHIRVFFTGCWFSGAIHLIPEGSNTPPNRFDLILSRCNYTDDSNIVVNGVTENPYPPKVYN